MVAFAIAIVPALAGILLFRAAPRFAFASWALVLFFVPIWVGFSAGYFYSAITAVTILSVAAASLRGLRWAKVDSVVLVFGILITMSFLFGGIAIGHLLVAILDWMLPYAWGRIVLARVELGFITKCIAAMTVIAAILALIEFVTGVNLFVLMHWANSGYSLWAPLQARGGFLRVEGAFGHSISLGASLSIGSVFVLSSRWQLAVQIASLGVIATAIVMTFSRIGLVGFALGILLSLAFLGNLLGPRIRATIAAVAVVATVAIIPFISEVFTEAGAEAQDSALYRVDLLSLLSKMLPVGLSKSYNVLPNGDVYIGNFQSIDSALILLGLRLGYIPLALVLGLLVTAAIFLFRSRANAPLVALVAQIPTLATVALITQLPYLLWFTAGLAVTMYILENGNAREPTVDDVRALLPRGEWKAHG